MGWVREREMRPVETSEETLRGLELADQCEDQKRKNALPSRGGRVAVEDKGPKKTKKAKEKKRLEKKVHYCLIYQVT